MRLLSCNRKTTKKRWVRPALSVSYGKELFYAIVHLNFAILFMVAAVNVDYLSVLDPEAFSRTAQRQIAIISPELIV